MSECHCRLNPSEQLIVSWREHYTKKVIFNVMMMMTFCTWLTWWVGILIVLAHWNNTSPCRSPRTHYVSDPSSLMPHTYRKNSNINYLMSDLRQPRIKSTITLTITQHNHYMTDMCLSLYCVKRMFIYWIVAFSASLQK